MIDQEDFRATAKTLSELVVQFAQKGWAPATSSNFSSRLSSNPNHIAISMSGKDKECFCADDVMIVDALGKAIYPENAKSSAETSLHLKCYERKDIGAVFHTHSKEATVISMQSGMEEVLLEGYEILKGIEGVTTHDHRETVPVIENSQNMLELVDVMSQRIDFDRHHAFLLAGHGLYVWGKDIVSAKRHLELFQYLFECELMRKRL